MPRRLHTLGITNLFHISIQSYGQFDIVFQLFLHKVSVSSEGYIAVAVMLSIISSVTPKAPQLLTPVISWLSACFRISGLQYEGPNRREYSFMI